jgi:hypothetical protein
MLLLPMQGYKKSTASRAMMEEQELDEWFNEQKERLEERFYAEAEKDVAKAKARFDKDYQLLIRQFQQKQGALYDQKARAARLHKPVDRMRERWRLTISEVRQWIAAKRLAVKKWRFDRKIRRILKDKSDL